MRLIDADLLEKKCKGSYLTPDDFRFEIRNAPTVEGKAVGYTYADLNVASLTSVIFKVSKEAPKDATLLYLAPQQPQSVAEALEEAAKLVESKIFMPRLYHELNLQNETLEDLAKDIRALIKRNAEGME